MLIPVHQSHSPIVQHYSYCFSATPWIIDIFLSSLSALGASLDDCCSLFNILYTLALFHHSLRSPTVNSVLLFGAHDNKEWWKSSGGHCCLLFVFYFAVLCWGCIYERSCKLLIYTPHHTTHFFTFMKDIIPTHHLHVHEIQYIKLFCNAFYLMYNIWIRLSQSDWMN